MVYTLLMKMSRPAVKITSVSSLNTDNFICNLRGPLVSPILNTNVTILLKYTREFLKKKKKKNPLFICGFTQLTHWQEPET